MIGPSDAAKLTILSSGNVGIGTITPSAALEVAGNAKINGTLNVTAFQIAGQAFNPANYVPLTGGSTLTGPLAATTLTASSGTVAGGATGLTLSAGGVNQNVTIAPAGTGNTLLGGNVGIGTSAPGAKLEINGNGQTLRFQAGTLLNNLIGAIEFKNGTNPYLSKIASYASDATYPDQTDLRFYTTGASLFERMRITAPGNVGIGTTAPAARLQVNGGNLYITGGNTNPTSGAGLDAYYDTTNLLSSIRSRNWDTSTLLPLELQTGDFRVDTNGAERLRITATGGVGIGTTQPGGQLTVRSPSTIVGTSKINALEITASGNAANNNGGLLGLVFSQNTNGTFAGPDRQAAIYSASEGTWSNSVGLAFYTQAEAQPIKEAMRITSGGAVGIGTSSPSATLDVNGSAVIENGNSLTFKPASGNSVFISSPGSSRMMFNVSGNSFEARPGGLMFPNGNYVMDQNSNAVLRFGLVGAAVNSFVISPAVSGGNPVLSATGNDANVGLTFSPKGTGNVLFTSGSVGIGGVSVPGATLDVAGNAKISSSLTVAGSISAGSLQVGGVGVSPTDYVSQNGTYSNPAWLTSLSATKISGVLATTNLPASGVTADTYTKVTVDVAGRVTGGTSLTSADIAAATAGTYSGTTAGLTLTAGGNGDQNITLTPTGAGYTKVNGSVGIGTTVAPTAALEVAGEVKAGTLTLVSGGRTTGALLLAQQGDLPMGEFTSGPTPQ